MHIESTPSLSQCTQKTSLNLVLVPSTLAITDEIVASFAFFLVLREPGKILVTRVKDAGCHQPFFYRLLANGHILKTVLDDSVSAWEQLGHGVALAISFEDAGTNQMWCQHTT